MFSATSSEVVAGCIVAAATFLAAWVYCTASYGFLFGFGLGWLPSAILAGIVGALITFAWRWLLGICAVLFLAVIIVSNHH